MSDNHFPLKLNLGCGPVQPAGWINVDGSLRAWLVSHFELVDRLSVALRLIPPTDFQGVTFARLDKPWPWASESVEAIYAGEILEHFTQSQGAFFIRESLRVLKPGGVLRIRVPDNARFWRNYLAEYDAATASPTTAVTLDHTRWIEMFFRDICVERRWIASYGHFHKWAYDDISLIRAIEDAGFANVARRAFLDSRIHDVSSVEVRDDLIVEGTRPV